jgi:hypothetical protein
MAPSRRRRRPLVLQEEAYSFSDAHSALYFSERYNVKQIEILLKFEAETKFELDLEEASVAA